MVLILNSSGPSFDLIGISLGDKIPGEIISIGRDTVFVDTATKASTHDFLACKAIFEKDGWPARP